MNALQSELLKYKRTFMGKLIVFSQCLLQDMHL